MSVSIRSIRLALLAGGSLLAATLLGVLGYAHLKTSRFSHELATRLGVDVRQETNGFTYSQSSKGKTIFTIHAAKAVQRQDGKIMLHDVGIVLYGRAGDDRADRIYGDEFEYDQSTGEARATGDIRIDLQAPAAAFRGKVEGGIHEPVVLPGHTDGRIIHVRTQGLLFQQKIGLASTPGLVEFSSGGVTGQATGAVYDSQTGKVVLESAISMMGMMKNGLSHLNATHGEFEQAAHQLRLENASFATTDQSVTADVVVVQTALDGTPRNVQATGHVVVMGKDQRVAAGRMDAALSEAGKPQNAHLYAEVTFSRPGEKGTASEARISFDSEGRTSEIWLNGRIAVEQRGLTSTRTLMASRLQVALSAAGPKRSILREARAFGDAALREIDSRGQVVLREVAGDTLVADFADVSGLAKLTSLTGTGHTVLRQVLQDGTEEKSSGTTLSANFQAGSGTALLSAVQRGEVETVRELGRTRETQRGSGDEESYDAGTNKIVLHGRAHVEDATGSVYAETITSDRFTGAMQAAGAVRVTYTPAVASGSKTRPEPVHVLADHATMQREGQTALFYGAADRPARIWEAGSQVEAPVLELTQVNRRLIARAKESTAVHAVLNPDGTKGENSGSLQVTTDEMIYSDLAREVQLTGHVHVESRDGGIRANEAKVYLAQASPVKTPADSSLAMPQGQVQKIVATGEVRVEQPDRHGEGERLVYTANDRIFVMTGTKTTPPRLSDLSRGTITGDVFRFRSGEQSMFISDSGSTTEPRRVRTETHLKR